MISFLITSKNEPYLDRTIDSIRSNAVSDYEILSEEDDGRGQRGMIDKLAKQANGDIICKVDAHCVFGPEFDKLLLEDLTENTVIAPSLYPWDGQNLNHHTMGICFDTVMMSFHTNENKSRLMKHTTDV